MSRPRILIVDDETALVDVLSYNFAREGFDVVTAGDGQAALQKCRTHVPDVVLLDLMLPAMDGLQVCRKIRSDSRLKDVRVIMLTAKGEETDEIVGFHLGADDYVAKPFRTRALIERVKALLRRREVDDSTDDVIEYEGIQIDRGRHTLTVHGNVAPTTPTEFMILWTLMRQPGRAFTRHELLDCARGEDANSLERTIDVHIRSLRKKLGEAADAIETVRSVGYRFRAQGRASAEA
ncbi:MAG: response regulator [Planctomycetota bacterium]|nr:MAG: response regulator [Planctomycetota bacterium]REJ94284.1 MAG: response regulator [Planctomycetota bacterium]REK26425.1 MAG: response regulator [Planctomycetota bacterium]REK32058.1 MAG: response regulator [Planctomycetota bacterium]